MVLFITMNNKVLYVTTFNKKLYEQSGILMIDSFMNYGGEGDLLVCYEDIDFETPNKEKIKTYCMENDKYMTEWLTEHSKNIPEMYGGTAGPNHPIVTQFNTKRGQYWANHRASRYFRKIVALNYALDNFANEYDIIFLIDVDCIFKKKMDTHMISTLFSDNQAMIYFWGKHRRNINRGPETGFTGYSKSNGGFDFARKICDCFGSGNFLKYQFWDDGYVIGKLITEHSDTVVLHDIVSQSDSKTTRVMEIQTQPLFNYIHHFKNKHQTSV